jgi:hypothetical protein
LLPNDPRAEVSRPAQVAAGLLLGLLCALFFAGGVFAIVAILGGHNFGNGAALFFALCVLLGGAGLVTSWRLVTGRRRVQDGGLFSPTTLRVAAVLWLLGTALLTYLQPIRVIEGAFFVGVSVSLFALARHREQWLHR